MKTLRTSLQLGRPAIANRIAMEPMTRAHAGAGGSADMVAFGRQYIANPDLVDRTAQGVPYNVPDHYSFYGGSARGYTDYPALAGFA